jgi:MFS family permease
LLGVLWISGQMPAGLYPQKLLAATSVPVALAGLALAGAGTSVCAPTLIGLAGRAVPDRAGAATGTVITLSYLGFVLGPAAVGGVAALTGLRTALAGVAAVALLGAAGARALPRG